MLIRIYSVRPPLRRLCRRYTTTPYDAVFKKLRAYPFQMTPEKAQRNMARWSSLLTGSTDKLISSAIASFLPFADYHRPIRFSAVYFPIWILNAEVEANVTYEKSQQMATAIFRNTYVPGSNVPILSAAPLWSRGLDYVEPDLFTEQLLKQHGEEVQCIPFTTSPFSVLDIPASSTDSSWTITRDLQVSPSSIKPTLFSAYPVLLPLYLAQYKIENSEDSKDSKDTVTLLIQAHADNGDIMTERLPDTDELPGAAFKMLNDLGVTKGFDLDSEVLGLSSFVGQPRVRVDSVSLRPVRDTADGIAEWLDAPMRSYRNIEKLASIGQLESDDDPRIREMTVEESQSLDKYFSLTSEITMVKRIINAMSEAQENTTVLSLSSGKMPKLENAEQATSTLKTKLKELEVRQHDLKPRWWVEWEEASRSKPGP